MLLLFPDSWGYLQSQKNTVCQVWSSNNNRWDKKKKKKNIQQIYSLILAHIISIN